MEILKDNFNKRTICGQCKSEFAYNERDIEVAYPTDELSAILKAHMRKYLDKSEAFDPTIFVMNGKIVRCPLCGAISIVHNPNSYIKRKIT